MQTHSTTRHPLSCLRFALITVAAIAVTAVTVPVWADDTVKASSTSLDEVLATNLESRGGEKAMQAAKSARMSGKMAMGPGMEAPFTITFKRPGMLRMEFEIQGMTGIQAYDGENAWGIMPFMGQKEPAALADDQLKQLQDQADFDGPLVDYKEKGHTVELQGTVDVDGTEAHKIKITKKNGDVMTTYLDTEYCLEFKQESRTSIQGNEMNVVIEIGDYKQVGDLMLPHSFNQTIEGAPAGQAINIDKIELNPEIGDDAFTMPKPAVEQATE